jgi:hypothetical protein
VSFKIGYVFEPSFAAQPAFVSFADAIFYPWTLGTRRHIKSESEEISILITVTGRRYKAYKGTKTSQ